MTRVLTKGTRTGVENTHIDWDEGENLIDHTIAFYDVRSLQQHHHEVTHPAFNLDDRLTLPSHVDVAQFLDGGNTMFVRLPTEQTVELRGEDHDGNTEYYECDLLEWLPFAVRLDSNREGELHEVTDLYASWEWYFDDDFEWQTTIDYLGSRAYYGRMYSDPRPPKSGPVPRSRAVPPESSHGPGTYDEVIAVNNVDRVIAATIHLEDTTEQGEQYQSEGAIYLIPPHPEIEFGPFVRGVLDREFGMDVEEQPEWVESYPIPGQSDIEAEIAELEDRVADLDARMDRGEWYQQLLFAKDEEDDDYPHELEEPVRDAFRSVGLDVSGEKPGRRDGAIQLDETTIVLEVTGTTRGISPGKVDRLERHVEDARKDDIGPNVTGLLVANPDCHTDPTDRSLNIQNYVGDLEENGYKLMATSEVYQMLCLFGDGDIDTTDITEALTDDDVIVEFDEDIGGAASLRDRLGAVRDRIGRLL